MITGALIIEGHVQGLSNTRALGELGIPVYVADKTSCIAQHSKFCKKFFRCPDFQTPAFAEFLIDLAEKEKIEGWVLIPSNDHAVHTISTFKSELERYYKIITPAIDVIEKIYNKTCLLAIAGQCGVPVPVTQQFRTVDDPLADNLQFPVLTKGINGLTFYKKMGRKAWLAHSEPELRDQLKLIEKSYGIQGTFTQELIPSDGTNKTISFTAFCVEGEIKAHWTGVKLREHPLQFGTATFAKSTYIAPCLQQSVDLLRTLKYTGVCEVEYLLDPRTNQYKLIEINARTWLWVELAKACGVNYARMIYDYVNGKEISYPASYQQGICWINPITDTVYGILGILKGRLKLSGYAASLFREKKINPLFLRNDWRPGVVYLLKLLSFLKER